MPKFKNYPELTVLAPDDAILVVDTSDTTDAADGSTKYVQQSTARTAVVQSALFETSGAVLWSTEAGWSATRTSTGIWEVTFPTAALTNESQALTCTANQKPGEVGERLISILEIITTGCRVICQDDAGGVSNTRFAIHRTVDNV